MNIVFNYLQLTDLPERKSKRVVFDKGDNLITSEKNSVGKSVIMKSLYHSLGADSSFDDNFKKDNILFELSFSSGDNHYLALRYKDSFCIFKNSSLVSFVKSGERTSLSSFYLSEFNVSVYLKNRNNSTELAPPAYLFIPYYLDQDRSWKEDQEPFSKQTMGQYETINKNELYLYHLNLLKKDYGELKTELDRNKSLCNAKKEKLSDLDKAYTEVKETIDATDIIVDTEELEILYRNNSIKADELIAKQKGLLQKISELDQKRLEILIRIKNNEKLIDKINNNKKTNTMIVECPNCKTEFDVELKDDITKVYSIVLLENENKTLELEQADYIKQINILKQQVNNYSSEINNISKQNESTRNNYEQYVARIALNSLLEKQLKTIGELHEEIKNLEKAITEKETRLKVLKEKNDKAKTDFCLNYCEYLSSLDVTLFDPRTIKAFYKARLSGSQYIRSTLAFYFAFLKTKETFNENSFNWPLVIDSPREGEQDDSNSYGILNFVLSQKHGQLQRIVASVDAIKYVDSDTLKTTNLIELPNNIGSVMTKEDYSTYENHINECLAYFKRD